MKLDFIGAPGTDVSFFYSIPSLSVPAAIQVDGEADWPSRCMNFEDRWIEN